MEKYCLNKKITKWKPKVFRPRGRPKVKWENDVKQDLNVMNILFEKKQVKNKNE